MSDLFLVDVPEWRAIDAQRAAARNLKIEAIGEDEFGEHSLHDWRHTRAVALIRAGYLEQIAADHWGHPITSTITLAHREEASDEIARV